MATQAGDLGRHRLATSSTRYEHSTTFKHYEDETTRVSAVLPAPPTYQRWRPQTRSASAALGASGCSLEQHSQPSYQAGPTSGDQSFSAIATATNASNSNNTYTTTGAHNQQPVNGSPQKVRVVAGEVQRERRCRPASADRFGGSSQRASRSSLGGAHSTNRMGRFVNYYPASRQPSPSRRRQPSPYAFHVPLHQQQRSNSRNNNSNISNPYNTTSTPSYQSQQQVAYGNSRATSPSYAYANFSPVDDYSPSTINDSYYQQQQQQQPDALGLHPCRPLVATPTIANSSSPRNAPGKFSKSLRSRTISHLPSMVQVTIEDDGDDYGIQYPNNDDSDAPPKQHLTNANSTSESDLVRRQLMDGKVWRSDAHINHDNPFKPGTELSWEADLMVRLIKRGYPIDQLPSLVEAAKLEAAARQQRKQQQQHATTKSCDRLERNGNTETQQHQHQDGTKQYVNVQTQAKNPSDGGGYLRSNLRQANQARQLSTSTNAVNNNQRRPISSAISHSSLVVAAKPNGQLGLTAAEHHQQPASRVGGGGAPNDCKAIWADSLRRAKSVPRFHHNQADADSLDKLITSIELEIGELLETGSPESLAKTIESENGGQNQQLAGVTNDNLDLDSPTKMKIKSTATTKKKKTPARQQSASKSYNGTTTKQTDLKTNRASKTNRRNELSEASETRTMSASPLTSGKKLMKEKKKKRPKCCTIQ